jgi:hypothetical protein
MRSVGLFAVLLVALFILGSVVSIPKGHSLSDTIWTGLAGDGKWETAGNWDNGVPTFSVLAEIPNGGFVVTISTAQIALTLSVGLGDTVTCERTCTLATENLSNLGTFINYRTVTLVGFDNVGAFTNYGTVYSNGLNNVGTFTNFGAVTIGRFVNDGTFTNRCHGTVNMTPTAGTGTFTTDPTCPLEAVGGVVTTANTLALVAPWLTVIGLVGCISTAVVVAKKRRS